MKPFLLIGMLFCYIISTAQGSDTTKKAAMSGYLKVLQGFQINKNFSTFTTTTLLHNRLNFKWAPTSKITGRLEMRNRFYWGDDVKRIPNFKDLLQNRNEAMSLSFTTLTSPTTVWHTNIERLWLEYRQARWNVRAGRQRINWGFNSIWNPNDLFNTYNFLDIDYEERPGSDAVKAQYLVTDLSHLEVAASASRNKPIVAVKWATNYKGYDWQAIIGSYQEQFTAGLGWAGSLGEAGFKGEAQWYAGKRDTAAQMNLSLEGDYILEKGWYLAAAILYNQKALAGPLTDWTKVSFEASPQNLMPTEWNLLLNIAKEFTPLFNGGFIIVYAPKENMLIFFPSLHYNLKNNLDADFIWQSFFLKQHTFQEVTHTGYLRLKWSF